MPILRDRNPFAAAGLAEADALAVKQRAVEFLRGQLDKSGMTQAELARRAGLAPSHVSEMLSGRLARFGMDRINATLAVFDGKIETSYALKIEVAK
ncbi:MAG: helix-turn-helix domain-containing protein [Tagaea sp.]